MRRYEVLAVVFLLLVMSTPAAAQVQLPTGNTVSASVNLTVPSVSGTTTTETVYTTPRLGSSFVLTQACAGATPTGTDLATIMYVSGKTFGSIADIEPAPFSGPSGCISFAPGYTMPPGEQIQCTLPFEGDVTGQYFCSISGVLVPSLGR